MSLTLEARDEVPALDPLWDDGERRFCRGWCRNQEGDRFPCMVILPVAEYPSSDLDSRLAHEFALRASIDSACALRPLELIRERGKTLLLLEYRDARLLDLSNEQPMELGRFFRLAIALTRSLARVHGCGLIHKDIKPTNILVDTVSEHIWLTGFGIASRLTRERQPPEPPALIAGTLSHMAPEQTGRMNRSIDSRSDLYSLGVTLYQMLTGRLPFSVTEPMEWVHCHIARTPAPTDHSTIPCEVSAIVTRLLAKTPEERYQTAAGLERDLVRCAREWETRRAITPFSLGMHDTPERLLTSEKLYGRQSEIEALVTAFEDVAASGTTRLLLVSGNAGVGKSSLVTELHKVVVPLRGLFASAKLDKIERQVPYAAITQAFRGLIRRVLTKPEAEVNQWRATLVEADVDTLDLLEALLVQPGLRYLLLLGAYRDNEVEAAHPLTDRLGSLQRAGVQVRTISLASLHADDVAALIGDALRCEIGRAAPLAHLVLEKTAGNPFFVREFLHALADERLLRFDPLAAAWIWDLNAIQAKQYTDNVVDLMVGKLRRLPLDTQELLSDMACLGVEASASTLAKVCERTEVETHAGLWDALHAQLVARGADGCYRFVHDRIHEAAYALIASEARASAHLRVGRRLGAELSAAEREEAIFDIVAQLNRGSAQMSSRDEREQLAACNVLAAKRARSATAYASALSYLVSAAALMDNDCWERLRDVCFERELQRAECEFLTGEVVAAAERAETLAARARGAVERAAVASLRIDVYTTSGESVRAVAVCLGYLRSLGDETWPMHPTANDARAEYELIWSRLGKRTIHALIDLPLMGDLVSLATLDVLAKTITPALFTDANLLSLVICRMVNLSIQNGNGDASCFAYVWLGHIAGPRFDNYQAAYEVGRVGHELVKTTTLRRFQGATNMCFAHGVMPWKEDFRACCEMTRRTFSEAYRTGDLTYAAASCNALVSQLLAAGEPLGAVQTEAEHGLAFAGRARFGLISDVITAQLALVRTLRGLTARFGCLDDAHTQLDERRFEQHLASMPSLAMAECWYWLRKLQARYFAGEYIEALQYADNAQRLLWTSPSMVETAELHFYAALARAAAWDAEPEGAGRQALQQALAAQHAQHRLWAQNCPSNFGARASLLAAEHARIQGRVLDAEAHYELAINSAQSHGMVQDEALACELASRFYSARGLDRIARAYMRDAHSAYLHWGADGKARQLERGYPYLRASPSPSSPTTSGLTEHLDLENLLKVLGAVYREIDLDQLITAIMRLSLEHAGAARGLLILPVETTFRIEAEAEVSSHVTNVELRQSQITSENVPELLFQYTLRTRESVVLQDAAAENLFADDPYFRRRRVRSVLCMPLVKQTRIVGVIYLENSLASGAFTPARMAVLNVLASEAAISLENARLYRDLQVREARIRRLVDSNIVGVVIWHADGRILDTNDAFLRIVGYSRTDLVAGMVRWTDLTTVEWHEHDGKALELIKDVGTVQAHEREYIRKDGSSVAVLAAGAIFDGTPDEGVAFVLDLTERKRAETELRRARAELAHVARVATLSTLAASIAHEINQPLSGIITNARTSLRMVDLDPPNLELARKAARQTIRDGKRAAEVVTRLRAMFSKQEITLEPLDLNEAIQEVVALTLSELQTHGVIVRSELEADLPRIVGDRIQLQQVVINLLRNASDAMQSVNDRPRRLLIRTERDACERVRLAVRDAGAGLDALNMASLFEPFYTTKPDGMGMGLSVSRSIIERHHGQIWAEANDGPGATFSFSIPRAPA